jgi:uncharacterized membrane protein
MVGRVNMEEKKERKEGFGKKIRGQFVTGLLVMIPLAASILILVWLFNSVDHILQPVIRQIWGHKIPGVGFGVTIVLIYLVGVVGRNVFGNRIVKYFDSLLNKVPIFRLLYRSISQIFQSFSDTSKTKFMQVVLVEFPHKGMRALGFVTNEITDKNGLKWFSVLIPHAPNPMSGFMEIVKEEDIMRTNISVDEAVKMVVSAGRTMPDGVHDKI